MRFCFCAYLLCVMLTWGDMTLQAQERPVEQGWSFGAGAGVLLAPAFPGSSDYQIMLVPSLSARFRDVFFASVEEGVGYNLINSDGWVAGPLLRVDFGREADGKNPFRVAGRASKELAGFEDVSTTLMAGGFVQRSSGPWESRLELLQGINGHEGGTAVLSASYRTNLTAGARQTPPLLFSTGPSLRWADGNYLDAYFGVSPRVALTTGLPIYRPHSGLASAGWNASMVRPLNRRLTLVAFVGYERLLAEAADSPLVRERGSANQFTTGLFLNYRL